LQGLPIATVAGSNGYDGQFYIQIALDPLLRGAKLQQVLDAPAYRARRILAPAIASCLSYSAFPSPDRLGGASARLTLSCCFF